MWKNPHRVGQQLESITDFTLENGPYLEGETEIQIPESIHFKLTDKIAIVGPSGAGKSTLLGLLYGISEKSRKKNYWNSIPLEKIDYQNQISLSVYCPQIPFIFRGTANENLLSSTFSKEKLMELLNRLAN